MIAAKKCELGLLETDGLRIGTNHGLWNSATAGRMCPGVAFPGIIIKESYWRWPHRNLDGNAIDFFVQVLGLSFHNAMRQIIGP